MNFALEMMDFVALMTILMQTARDEALALTVEARATEAARLWKQLHVKHDVGEPARIGAAYKLASIGDEELALTVRCSHYNDCFPH